MFRWIKWATSRTTRVCGRSLPTINYALEKGAKVIIASHLGRPKGKSVEEMSLKPVVKILSGLLKKDVVFVDDCVGEKVRTSRKQNERWRCNSSGKSAISIREKIKTTRNLPKSSPLFATYILTMPLPFRTGRRHPIRRLPNLLKSAPRDSC